MIKNIWLAGGCFWGVQKYFDNLKGVVNTYVGYSQGNLMNPKYEDVKTGLTNHVEVVKIEYDNRILGLEKILENLFLIIDPHSLNKQDIDEGTQYRTGIYYIDEYDYNVSKLFLEHKQRLTTKKIVVEVKRLKNFFLAEEYHQKYLDKNPGTGCHVNFNLLNIKDRKR